MFKKLTTVVLVSSFLVFTSPSVSLGRDVFDTTLKGTVYGGIIGTLIGAAILAFTDKPGENLAYLAYGAGAGIIAGAAVGLAHSSRAMIEVKDKRVCLNMPEVNTEISGKDKYSGKMDVVGRINLFQYNF